MIYFNCNRNVTVVHSQASLFYLSPSYCMSGSVNDGLTSGGPGKGWVSGWGDGLFHVFNNSHAHPLGTGPAWFASRLA